MTIGRAIRPKEDASREEVVAYYKAVTAALEKAEVGYGEEFVVCPVSALQTSIYDAAKPDSASLGAFSGKAPDTSRKAAIDNYPRSGTQRAKVLDEIVKSGRNGRTRDELTFLCELPPNVATPRVKELVVGGWVEETDRTRRTRAKSEAAILVASEKTLQERSGEP